MDTTTVNRIGEGFDPMVMLSHLASFLQIYWFPIAMVIAGWSLFNLFKSSSLYTRLWRNLEDNVLNNWRLVLLGMTGIILSLASGWTTWDGMRNFTHGPLLSFMITFGIQGVMLIVAWLIGESFATGMSQRAGPDAQSRSGTETALGMAIGVLLFVAVAAWGMRFLNVQETAGGVEAGVNWSNVANGALILVIAMLALASMMVNRKSELVSPYLQGSRVIAKNAVLWVMFLACMGTSVFFSFDSLFSNIFPQSERKRAAVIRTTNQVAGIVADIGTLSARRRLGAAEQLFETDQWHSYEAQLDKIDALARTAPGLIRQQVRRELEEQNRQLKKLQEKHANALSAQAGLSARKTQLSEKISRLGGLRPGFASETLEPKAKVAQLQRQLDEQRAKTLAEEKGVEGSLKVGRGPKYRESRNAEDLIKSRLQVARKRLKYAEDRVKRTDHAIAAAKAELAQIDGDLAKLKGEAATVEQLIDVTKSNNAGKENATFDPAVGLAQLQRARQAFHQNPTQETLTRIQNGCGTIHSAMMRVESLKDRAAAISCDPGQAGEAAAPVFALNAGIKAFEANCAGGSKLPASGGTDTMLRFGRQCLQDSGLPSRDTAALGAQLSAVELSRDDKAHRFVVTWNAFQDGNRLAFLALGIAVAIDALVFMSGLFGANMLRSPLSDVPSPLARSAKQLDAIIDNALLPDRFDNACLALAAMHPITEEDGYTQEVVIDGINRHHDDRLRKVLNAGATIGAVKRIAPGHYHARCELFEFLSLVAKREFDANKNHGRQNELEKLIAVALLPEVGDNSETMLSYLHPIDEVNGFTSEVRLDEVTDEHLATVRNVLNAGATLQVVQLATKVPPHYFIHADLYKILARIRASALFRPAVASGPQIAAQPQDGGIRQGGSLNKPPKTLPAPPPTTHGAAPASPQMPPIRQSQNGNAAHDDPRLEKQIRDELARAIGLAPGAYSQLTSSGILQHAGATIDALHGLNRRAGELWSFFEFELQDARQKLQDARQHLASKYPGDAAVQQVINNVAQEVDAVLEPLMLTPGGPYERIIGDLLKRMEEPAGEGRLDDREEAIHARLKLHKHLLESNKRRTADDWRAVAELIARYDENVSVHEQQPNDGRPN